MDRWSKRAEHQSSLQAEHRGGMDVERNDPWESWGRLPRRGDVRHGSWKRTQHLTGGGQGRGTQAAVTQGEGPGSRAAATCLCVRSRDGSQALGSGRLSRE